MKKLVVLSIVWMFILYAGVASAAPGDYCGSGKVVDCAGKCVRVSTVNNWVNDSLCDDGYWGLDLICAAFNYDGGDCDEDGGECSTATPVELNTVTSGIIDFGGDQDYFSVSVPERGTLRVFTTGTTDTYGYLRYSNSFEVSSDDDSGAGYNFHIGHAVDHGMTYFVGVRHYSSRRTGEYELHIEFIPDDDHGDNCSTATPVDMNTVTPGVITPPDLLSFGGIDYSTIDHDYFRIDIPVAGTLTAYTSGPTNTFGYLKAAACELLLSDDNSGQFNNFMLRKYVYPGTYYIQVKHYDYLPYYGVYYLHFNLSPAYGPDATKRLLDDLFDDGYRIGPTVAFP